MKNTRYFNILFIALLSLLSEITNVQAQGFVYPNKPSKEQLQQSLKKEHPRLYLNAKEWENLKVDTRAVPVIKKWHEKVMQTANAQLNEPIVEFIIPDGRRLLATSKKVLSYASNLGYAYKLTGEKKYADKLWQQVEAASKFPDWNPKHLLDVGEMTHAFAITYDWLYDYWTPEQKRIMSSAILEKGLLHAMRGYEKLFPYSGFAQSEINWSQVCNGGMGVGAMAIFEEEPLFCSYIVSEAIESIAFTMKTYAPDGGWDEGPHYWHYATEYNVFFNLGLETSFGSDFGLNALPGFSNTANYPIYLNGPYNATFNFADGPDQTEIKSAFIHAPEMFFLASKFNMPIAAEYELAQEKSNVWDILFCSKYQQQNAKASSLPKDAYFRFVEVITMRSQWKNPNAWFLGAKAGSSSVSHCHLDLGHFVLDYKGKRWAVDLGKENYNLKGYWDMKGDNAGRWKFFRMRAESHNCLVINPDTLADQSTDAFPVFNRTSMNTASPFGITDISAAYKGKITKAERGFAMPNRQMAIIQDELIPNGNTKDVWWFMMTGAKINLSTDGKKATLTQDGESLDFYIASPANAKFSITPAEPLPNTPNKAGIHKNEGFQRLTIHLGEIKNPTTIKVVAGAKPTQVPKAFQGSLSSWK